MTLPTMSILFPGIPLSVYVWSLMSSCAVERKNALCPANASWFGNIACASATFRCSGLTTMHVSASQQTPYSITAIGPVYAHVRDDGELARALREHLALDGLVRRPVLQNRVDLLHSLDDLLDGFRDRALERVRLRDPELLQVARRRLWREEREQSVDAVLDIDTISAK